jgi:hypothetical protein
MAVGTSMLQQSGKTYFESGRRYMQSWTGVVSGGMLHYHFDINAEYGARHAQLPASSPHALHVGRSPPPRPQHAW